MYASNSPEPTWFRLRKMIGPFAITVLTTKVDSTTTNTEQKARQKWHLRLIISLTECLMKNRNS